MAIRLRKVRGGVQPPRARAMARQRKLLKRSVEPPMGKTANSTFSSRSGKRATDKLLAAGVAWADRCR
jgi:hypothetical protein